jgi:hypothetical protein
VRPHLASIRNISIFALALTAQAAPASAQGFFEQLFSGDRYAPRRQEYVPQRGQAYSTPFSSPAPVRSYSPVPERQHSASSSTSASSGGGGGQYVAYCVRLCDGRYFPMQRHNNATSIQLCNGFCPATKTQVFNGSQIDHAVASNGARYTNLANAFVYREKIVPDCTCNGKDSFGLAKIDVKSDPTLRSGDIVATGDNQKAALAAAANRLATRNAMVEKAAALRTSPSKAAGAGASAQPASDTEERPED